MRGLEPFILTPFSEKKRGLKHMEWGREKEKNSGFYNRL